MKIEATTIEGFFDNCGKWENLIRESDKKLKNLLSSLDRKIYDKKSITLLGYGGIKDKKGEIWPLVSIAPQKNTVSIYVSATKNNTYILDSYQDKLKDCVLGKGCIKFKNVNLINQDNFTQLILDCLTFFNEKNSKNQET